jgi:hypothetical protein
MLQIMACSVLLASGHPGMMMSISEVRSFNMMVGREGLYCNVDSESSEGPETLYSHIYIHKMLNFLR